MHYPDKIQNNNHSLQWELTALSECGRRDENQDNYLLIDGLGGCRYLKNQEQQRNDLAHWPSNHLRLVVADGMGGHKNGRQISEDLVELLMDLPFQDNIDSFKKALLAIHQCLFSQYHQGPKTPGTTLVIADIDDKGNAIVANIGDSRAFLWQKKSWQTLSYDHTSSEFAWRDGEINDAKYEKALQHSDHRIVQAVGYGSIGIIPNRQGKKFRQHIEPLRLDLDTNHQDIKQYQLSSGDVLLLASDGLWSDQSNGYQPSAYESEMNLILSTYGRNQIQQVLREGGTDNVTILAAACFLPAIPTRK